MVNQYFSSDDVNISVYVTCKALYGPYKKSTLKESIHIPKNNIYDTLNDFDILQALESQVNNNNPDPSFSIKNILLTQNEIDNATGSINIQELFSDFFASHETNIFLIQIFFKNSNNLYSLPSNIVDLDVEFVWYCGIDIDSPSGFGCIKIPTIDTLGQDIDTYSSQEECEQNSLCTKKYYCSLGPDGYYCEELRVGDAPEGATGYNTIEECNMHCLDTPTYTTETPAIPTPPPGYLFYQWGCSPEAQLSCESAGGVWDNSMCGGEHSSAAALCWLPPIPNPS